MLPDILKTDLNLQLLPAAADGPLLMLSVPARLRRTGMETKLLVQGPSGAEPTRRQNRSLVRLIAQARQLHDMVMASNGKPIRELAAEAGLSPSYVTRVFRLSFLAPDLTKAILEGRQPREFSAIKLMRAGRLKSAWADQRRQLSFG
jgi:AraC-like DNA-binding protein